MKKKWLTLLCAALIAAATTIPAGAAQDMRSVQREPSLSDNYIVKGREALIEPTLYSNLNSETRAYAIADMAVIMQPVSNSMVACSCSIDMIRAGCTVEATMTVEKWNGSEWESMRQKSFTVTEFGSTVKDLRYYTTRGRYRCTLSATTYDENGKLRDVISISTGVLDR